MPPVFGIDFSPTTQADLVRTIAREPAPSGAGARLVVTANLDHVVHLTRNAELRAAYDGAWIRTADGAPVYVYARWRGAGLPARVTGSGMFRELADALSPLRHRCFFVAGSDVTAEKLLAAFTARGFEPRSLASDIPPFGFEKDATYSDALARQVREHGTTHLFLGVGAPKSEIWAHRHRSMLGDCYVLAVGAGLDMFVGQRRRAPRWVQTIGMEWFWRFAQEPRRLFRRYFVDSWRFLGAIRSDLVGRS